MGVGAGAGVTAPSSRAARVSRGGGAATYNNMEYKAEGAQGKRKRYTAGGAKLPHAPTKPLHSRPPSTGIVMPVM